MSFDTTWSHIRQAAYASGACIEMLTRAVASRHHCCSKPNSADPSAPVYNDTSKSMEGECAKECFKQLQGLLKILFGCFDGDASTPQHMISYHPDAKATRDPNHIAKNVYNMLLQCYKELKYSCSCENVKTKKGETSKTKKHNPITKKKAKDAQLWVGSILRNSTEQKEAKKLLENFLDHLEGQCKEGGGCKHTFPQKEKNKKGSQVYHV